MSNVLYIKRGFNITILVLASKLCTVDTNCLLIPQDLMWNGNSFKKGKRVAIKIKYIYICTLKQIVGSRINRHSTVVTLMKLPVRHPCSFCLALALQWLMQPIKCREHKLTILTRNSSLSNDSFHIIRHVMWQRHF